MRRKFFEYAEIAASVVLIVVGAGSIALGAWGVNEVRDNLARENIVGTPDSSIPGQNMAVLSERVAVFGISPELVRYSPTAVIGIALLLTGIGFLVLMLRTKPAERPEARPATVTS